MSDSCWLPALVALMLLTGCQTTSLETPAGHDLSDVPVPTASAEEPAIGSLYSEATAVSYFRSPTAYRVGDILTVSLDEQTRSSKQAGTQLNKNNKVGIESPTLLGKQPLGTGAAVDIAADRSFAGKGTTGQSNELSGFVTVMVHAVLANGLLYVKGSKVTRLTHGDEVLYISGFVRPKDILPDNRVSSRRLADARISYTGRGEFAEANMPGWVGRILNHRLFPF
ncbi:MAG: flagellar basal body L-ring protein FlgH [Kistimonas sp.]|nr:flagellar basal body L-ring protein FlgH [Kistimonas sp.]